jgi:hypothetical protein
MCFSVTEPLRAPCVHMNISIQFELQNNTKNFMYLFPEHSVYVNTYILYMIYKKNRLILLKSIHKM